MIDVTQTQDITSFLLKAIQELSLEGSCMIDTHTLHQFIVKRDGSSPYSEQDIEVWIAGIGCLE